MTEAQFHEQAAALHRALANLHQQRAEAEGATRSFRVGEKGKIMDLRSKIIDLLADQPNKTTAEVADLLYTDALGIDRGTFRRRVIVTMSAMYKKRILRTYYPAGAKAMRFHLSNDTAKAHQQNKQPNE